MAAKKKRRTDIRQPILIVYVSVCVIAVVLTVVIAFGEANGASQLTQPTATRTLSPLILTQQADGYGPSATHPVSTPTPTHARPGAPTEVPTLDADEH